VAWRQLAASGDVKTPHTNRIPGWLQKPALHPQTAHGLASLPRHTCPSHHLPPHSEISGTLHPPPLPLRGSTAQKPTTPNSTRGFKCDRHTSATRHSCFYTPFSIGRAGLCISSIRRISNLSCLSCDMNSGCTRIALSRRRVWSL
jgi:hypothetical protein